MKQEMISKVLKVFTVLAGILGGLFFYWYFPHAIEVVIMENPEVQFLQIPSYIGIGCLSIVCYVALFFFWKVCDKIGKQESFCVENASSMKMISIMASLVCVIIVVGDIYLGVVGFLHPGLLIVSLVFIFIGSSFAVICFSLSSLILNAVTIKEENDLTI